MEEKLVLLTTESCGHCKTIKEHHPELQCKVLSTQEDMAACKAFGIMAVCKAFGIMAVPVLLVRGDDETILKAIEAVNGTSK